MSPKKRGRPTGTGGPHAPKTGVGVMRADEVLTMKAFMDRMGVSWGGVRRMIDRGLKVRVDGRYRRIHGQDYPDYLLTLPCVPVSQKKEKPNDATGKQTDD